MVTSRKKWLFLDLGLMDYRESWALQLRLVDARKDDLLKNDVVLFLEHPAVFTLGRRGGHANLKVTESFLASRGIPLVHVERGGDITYHGPGQLVAYPVVHLRAMGLGVLPFVEGLEEIMIRTAAEWAIKAERNPRNRGAWVGPNKIGSIGIAVRRSVSFHGLALKILIRLTIVSDSPAGSVCNCFATALAPSPRYWATVCSILVADSRSPTCS